MGFTVTRPVGTKDAEFQAYARLLRQRGVDLSRVPRVLEPSTGRRWLYVWAAEPEAAAFAQELRQRTGDGTWQVQQVDTPPSEGPLGPVLLQLGRQSDGLVFGLHPLSRAMLQSAFPNTIRTTRVFMNTQHWRDFQTTQGNLADLTWQIALTLTGLKADGLVALGLELIDGETNETVVAFPPRASGQAERGAVADAG